jgi:hypothetical protein
MLGAPSTQVFALETYPLDNAVITEAYPPTQTLCVRRTDNAPYLALWDSWKDAPNLQSADVALNQADALRLVTAEHTYYIAFGPGVAEYGDGVRLESDAAFTLVRNRDAVTLVHGTAFTISGPEGSSTLRLSTPATISMVWTSLETKVRLEGDISHDTFGGEDHPRPVPDVTYTVEGSWLGA